MQALLIIDMQVGSFASVPRLEADLVIDRINQLAERFRSRQEPVIFIQHDGSAEGELIPGSDDWQLLPQLIRTNTEKIIAKTANDAFYRTGLADHLREQAIDHLFITGCATDFCVNATVHSALVKDYDLTIVSDGHTTADRPNLTARQLIDFHNWLWPNLATTRGRIVSHTASEILKTCK